MEDETGDSGSDSQVKRSRNTRSSIPRHMSFLEPRVLNPFVSELNLPWYEYIKIALMSVTIAPIRLILLTTVLGFIWTLSFVGTCGLDVMEDKPMSRWRMTIAGAVRRVSRVAFFFAGFHWIKIKGNRADVKKAGVIVIAPHSTFLDVIVMFACNALPMPISRQESILHPFVGRMLRMTQPICVKREDPESRHNTVSEIKRRARGRDEGWPQVCLFPEGTTTNRSCLITFKVGAFLPGVPIQPLLLRWPNRVNWMTWTWQGHNALVGLWIGLCQFHSYVEIELLPVYYPNEDELEDPQRFADNVRKLMAEALEVPMTDHSFEDCRLMMLAKKHNLPMASGIVEFSKLSRKLNLNYDAMKEMLERFTEMTSHYEQQPSMRGRGRRTATVHPVVITFNEFAEYLGLLPSPALKRVFDLYDRNRSGTIDFREYVIGLSLISSPANSDETIENAFRLFDEEGKGFVTREDLTKILSSSFSMTENQCNDLYDKVDAEGKGKISYDDFSSYAKSNPEYSKLFMVYTNFDTERSRKQNSKKEN